MTDTPPPIACSLSEHDLSDRKELLRSALAPFIAQAACSPGLSSLEFSKPDVTRKMLQDMISQERECCPSLSFDLSETDTHFQVNVTGPKGSEDMVRDLFAMRTDAACGCAGSDKPPSSQKKYVFGFITLCAIGCAVPPTLAALGLIGAATGAYLGKWVEAAVVLALVLGCGFLFAQYLRKRQTKASP